MECSFLVLDSVQNQFVFDAESYRGFLKQRCLPEASLRPKPIFLCHKLLVVLITERICTNNLQSVLQLPARHESKMSLEAFQGSHLDHHLVENSYHLPTSIPVAKYLSILVQTKMLVDTQFMVLDELPELAKHRVMVVVFFECDIRSNNIK